MAIAEFESTTCGPQPGAGLARRPLVTDEPIGLRRAGFPVDLCVGNPLRVLELREREDIGLFELRPRRPGPDVLEQLLAMRILPLRVVEGNCILDLRRGEELTGFRLLHLPSDDNYIAPVVCQKSIASSCGGPVVEVEQPTQPFETLDRRISSAQ